MPKTKKFLKPTFPDLIVMEYGKAIIKELDKINQLTQEILIPHLDKIVGTKDQRLDSTIRLDVELKHLAGVALVGELIRRMKSKFYGEVLGEDQEPSQRLFSRSIRRLVQPFMRETKNFTEKRFVKEFERQTGTSPLPKTLDVKTFVDEATIKNINLIKSIPQVHFGKIQTLVENAVNRGQLSRDVKEELLNIKDVSENSARLIARDQIGKLISSVNEARQRKNNVTHYIWRDMEDTRVRSFANSNGRSDHKRLGGALIPWDKPPITVFRGKRAGERHHAGMDIQCRCFPQPVYDFITGIVHPETVAARKKSISLGLIAA